MLMILGLAYMREPAFQELHAAYPRLILTWSFELRRAPLKRRTYMGHLLEVPRFMGRVVDRST